VSVVTNHHRSNSLAIATAKRVHPINSEIVLGLFRARLSLLHLCLQALLSDCRPWLDKVRLTMFAFRYPSAQLLRDQYATKEKRDDFSLAYPSPGRRTRRRPGAREPHVRGSGLESFLSADLKQQVQVLRWLCLQHQPDFTISEFRCQRNHFVHSEEMLCPRAAATFAVVRRAQASGLWRAGRLPP